MATYFVSPETDVDWAFDADALAADIGAHFTDADVRGPDTPADAYQLHWTLPTPTGVPLEGALDREGDGVTLDGDIADCARFAVWLRTVAPADSGLLFYDQGYTNAVPLDPAPGVDDITEAFD